MVQLLDKHLEGGAVGVEEGVALGDRLEHLKSEWLRAALGVAVTKVGSDGGPNIASGIAEHKADNQSES